jgi:hypothetical protein
MEMLGQTLEEPRTIGLAKVDRDISAEDHVKLRIDTLNRKRLENQWEKV